MALTRHQGVPLVYSPSAGSSAFHTNKRLVIEPGRTQVRHSDGEANQARRASGHEGLEGAIREHLYISNGSATLFVRTTTADYIRHQGHGLLSAILSNSAH